MQFFSPLEIMDITQSGLKHFLSFFSIYCFLRTVQMTGKQSMGMWWRNLLGHCATSRKVAGSIPDGIIGMFHSYKPSGRTVVLESTQFLTEMSTTNISWGAKAAGTYN